MDIKIIEVFNVGSEDCLHNFIYSPISEMVFDGRVYFKTKRVCENCGRFELTLEKVKRSKINNYYTILDQFGLEV